MTEIFSDFWQFQFQELDFEMYSVMALLLILGVSLVGGECVTRRVLIQSCTSNLVTASRARTAFVPGGDRVVVQNTRLGILICKAPCFVSEKGENNL